MTIVRKPFTTTRLEEERVNDTSEPITLRLNLQEREELENVKELLDIGGDSQAIKFLMESGLRVIQATLSEGQIKYLLSLKRSRYDARKRKSKNRIFPKITQNGEEK